MPSWVRAQMTATSAIDARPIHRLAPLMTQRLPTWLRRRGHAGWVAAGFRLGQAEAADQIAGRHSGQPALLVRLGTELVDGAHGQRPLHADKGPQPGIARLQFQRGQAVLHRTAAGGAVPGQVGAEQAEPPHLGDDLGGKYCLLVPLDDVRPDPVTDERADSVPPGNLPGRQQGVQAEIVHGQIGHADLQSSGSFGQDGERHFPERMPLQPKTMRGRAPSPRQRPASTGHRSGALAGEYFIHQVSTLTGGTCVSRLNSDI